MQCQALTRLRRKQRLLNKSQKGCVWWPIYRPSRARPANLDDQPSDIPSNTFVDFSTIAGSRQVASVILTVELPCGSRPENSGLFPVRITLSSFRSFGFPESSVLLGRGYQGCILLAREAMAGDDCGNELVQTIASRKVYRQGREDRTIDALTGLETPIAIDPEVDSHVRTEQRRGEQFREVTGELILGCESGRAFIVLFNPNSRAAMTKCSAWNGIIRSGRFSASGL